jgi:hypothetical protein
MNRREVPALDPPRPARRKRQVPSERAAPSGRAERTTSASIEPRGAPERSLRLLEILIEVPGPATLASLAQASGLEPNTAHRLLERLVKTGYARKCETTRRYSAAARALHPMSLYHPLNRLRLECREQLRHLRERHDQSVCLIVFVGRERVIIDFVPGREPLSPLYGTWPTRDREDPDAPGPGPAASAQGPGARGGARLKRPCAGRAPAAPDIGQRTHHPTGCATWRQPQMALRRRSARRG